MCRSESSLRDRHSLHIGECGKNAPSTKGRRPTAKQELGQRRGFVSALISFKSSHTAWNSLPSTLCRPRRRDPGLRLYVSRHRSLVSYRAATIRNSPPHASRNISKRGISSTLLPARIMASASCIWRCAGCSIGSRSASRSGVHAIQPSSIRSAPNSWRPRRGSRLDLPIWAVIQQ